MTHTVHARGRRVGVAALAALMLGPAAALAQSDYSDKDLSVRMAPGLIRLMEVTTLGGETAANRYSSAINPAAAGWTAIPDVGLVFAPYYSYLDFGNGTQMHVIGESMTWDTRQWGTIQPTLSQIRTNEATLRNGLDFDFEVNAYQAVWGKRWNDFAVGALFNFAESRAEQEFGPLPVAEAEAESYRFRVGGLYQPSEDWLAGLVFEYGFAPTRTELLVPTAFGVIPVRTDDTNHQFILRPAVSFEYAEMSSVYVDYQYGVFYNDDDILHSHRFSAGVDHRWKRLPFLSTRAGAFVDARGNVGVTAGVGASLPHVTIDLGYQYNMFPELQPEFGYSNLVQVVVSLRV